MKYLVGEQFRAPNMNNKIYKIVRIYKDSHNSMAFSIDRQKSDFMCSEENLDMYIKLGNLVRCNVLPDDLFIL